MRLEERRTLELGLYAGLAAAAGAVLLPFAVYFVGMALAPPPPVPAPSGAPPLLLDALWARAGGGRAAELRPLNHLTMAQYVACVVTAPGANDNERAVHCRHHMPALRALEHLSALHLKDHGMDRNSLRGGHGSMATTVWLTYSWTKADVLNTLAARGDYGYGWRGVEAAARGYYGRAAGELTLPQAALVASIIGDRITDVWCQPIATTGKRNRILQEMHDNGAISDGELQAAMAAPLGLAPPPSSHAPCK